LAQKRKVQQQSCTATSPGSLPPPPFRLARGLPVFIMSPCFMILTHYGGGGVCVWTCAGLMKNTDWGPLAQLCAFGTVINNLINKPYGTGGPCQASFVWYCHGSVNMMTKSKQCVCVCLSVSSIQDRYSNCNLFLINHRHIKHPPDAKTHIGPNSGKWKKKKYSSEAAGTWQSQQCKETKQDDQALFSSCNTY
jgi:hypothetical protein